MHLFRVGVTQHFSILVVGLSIFQISYTKVAKWQQKLLFTSLYFLIMMFAVSLAPHGRLLSPQ